MDTAVAANDLDELNSLSAEELLAWARQHHGERAAIFTSFQDTGCVMIDMAHRVAAGLRVVTVDTRKLHNETYALIDRISARYGVPIERFEPDPVRLERMVARHGEYLFFDGPEKQEFCCKIRKVEANERALKTVDVWITGLRRDHSNGRSVTPKAALVQRDGREIIKLCPLADWTEQQVWDYIREHEVPYNALYDQGYTSIGCAVCSTPTLPHEGKRAGRWRWLNRLKENEHKECGIHADGSGI